MSWDRCLARVTSRRTESRDAVTLTLQPNPHFAGFLPGQHVNVTADVEGTRITRSYSLSDVPRTDRTISITVRRVDGGKLSAQLCSNTKVGDVLEIGPAFGAMTWQQEPLSPRLLLAAGSGITPLMSLLRSAVAAPQGVNTDLVYWARRRADLCFADELRQLAARIPGFRFHAVLTRETERSGSESAGRPSADLIARLVPDFALRRVSACGPHGFVGSVQKLLADQVVAFESESFTPPAAPVAALGTVRVELLKSGRTLELSTGIALLPALEAHGIRPAYGCRMGICNTCACGKQSGTTQNLLSGDADMEPASALRICVNRATSDLVLDL